MLGRGGTTGSKGHKLILLARLILGLVKVISRDTRDFLKLAPSIQGGCPSSKVLLHKFSAQEFLTFQSAKHTLEPLLPPSWSMHTPMHTLHMQLCEMLSQTTSHYFSLFAPVSLSSSYMYSCVWSQVRWSSAPPPSGPALMQLFTLWPLP